MKTNKLTQMALLLSIAAAMPAFAAEPVAAAEKEKTEASSDKTTVPVVEKGSLSAVIGDSVTFSTLKKALIAAELDVTLGTKGAYTIFAPTDEAFDKLPAGTLGKLLLPENKEKLRSLLLYHVVPGKVLAAELKEGEVKTMNGEKVDVDIDGDTIKVEDAKVFSADQAATNGVMHSVGQVLVPKSLDGFAGLKED